MKRLLLLIFISCAVFSKTNSQTFEELRNVYPVSQNNGKKVITGFQEFNTTDKQILANSMLWTINNICELGRDRMYDVNVTKNEFSFNLSLEDVVNGKPKYIFYCKVLIRVNGNKLVYTLYDIQYKAGMIMSLASLASLDRLTPEKKPKHKEIIDSFQTMASGVLNKIFDAVVANECAPVTHWQDIHLQRAVKGLNPDECLLAFGKPQSIYESDSNGVQWSYNLNFVLIFKKGVVETIIR